MSKALQINVDEWAQEQLAVLQGQLQNSESAREFGVDVTLEVAARVAMIRGLKAIVRGSVPSPSAPSTSVEEESSDVPDEPVVESNPDGTVNIPSGWSAWAGELVPSEQATVHEYYVANGWKRMLGKVGDESISFYWSNRIENQRLAPWGSPDANGKSIVVQKTPWGPGHLVPHGWYAEAPR
jgi:hypothetical protein